MVENRLRWFGHGGKDCGFCSKESRFDEGGSQTKLEVEEDLEKLNEKLLVKTSRFTSWTETWFLIEHYHEV